MFSGANTSVANMKCVGQIDICEHYIHLQVFLQTTLCLKVQSSWGIILSYLFSLLLSHTQSFLSPIYFCLSMYLLVIVSIRYGFPQRAEFFPSCHPALSLQSCVYDKQDICYVKETSWINSNCPSEKCSTCCHKSKQPGVDVISTEGHLQNTRLHLIMETELE